MKRFITLGICSLIWITGLAQAPEKFSFQAVIRDAGNALINNQQVGLRISILQGSIFGASVFVETHNTTTNANGLATLEIGSGTTVFGNMGNINWGNGPYFIKTEVDPTGGSSYSIQGTSQLLSVPYALHAKTATSVTGASGFSHYIGERYQGGVIFHLWRDSLGVEHGLIVATTDQSTGQAWSNVTSSMIGAPAQSTWDGLANCSAIISQPGHTNSAARLGLDLVHAGFNDWYLPSVDELSLLWQNRFNVNKTLSTIPGATQLPFSTHYWSSTEGSAISAWYFSFYVGHAWYDNKSYQASVRVIRGF